jgi:transcriptional regulator with XRE-family HTH domain
MALAVSDVREVVERVCARPDVLEACGNRDLGVVIEVLGAHGVTQGQIAGLTGISQGRLSEYQNHKRKPTASSIFEAFADGLGIPPTARRALGLSSEPAVASVALLTSPSSPDLGLVYPRAPGEASDNLTRLWRADLGGAPLLQAASILDAMSHQATYTGKLLTWRFGVDPVSVPSAAQRGAPSFGGGGELRCISRRECVVLHASILEARVRST